MTPINKLFPPIFIFLLLCSFVLFRPLRTYATQYRIKGSVIKNSSGVSGAVVKFNGGNPATTDGAGDYDSGLMNGGTYTVTYQGPPNGNTMVWPNGSSTYNNIKIGPGCSVNGAPGTAHCGLDDSIAELDFKYQPQPNCSNTISCGACGGGTLNTCSNNGTKSCTYTGPAPCTQVAAPSQTCSINNCDSSHTCSGGTCVLNNCTTTIVCGACNPTSSNTCNNGNGTQSCTYTGPSPCANVPAPTQACTINACTSPTTICSGGSCILPTYTISGNVFKDFNADGLNTAGIDTGFSGIQVIATPASGGSSLPAATTDASGNYTISGAAGNTTYNVTPTISSGYQATTAKPLSITISNANVNGKNFGITPLYNISGTVFVDLNGDGFMNNGEQPYTNSSSTITFTGPTNTSTPTSTGAYTLGQILKPGTYTVSYTSLPSGYFMTYPLPPSFSVTVGTPGKTPNCFTNGLNSATCDASGNIMSLNFGISNEKPWTQSICGDYRIDNASGINDQIPANPVCGSNPSAPYLIVANTTICTAPGVAFSGSTNANFGGNGGKASANPYNFLAGSSLYPENYTPVNAGVIRTSYNYILAVAKQAGINSTDIAPYCTPSIANCTLNPATFPHGLYRANGNLYLNAFTALANTNYVILVNGDLHIQGNISIPQTSTVTFSASGNIYVDKVVGTVPGTGTSATNVTYPSNLDGFYSADNSFIISSAGSCSDLQLNIAGGVTVNAAKQGGTFQNNRDLCVKNYSCPAVTFTQRPDFFIFSPSFIKHQPSLFQEVAP